MGKEGLQQPLEYFIEVMNDKDQPVNIRLDAGKAAAPHIHRKMPTAIENEITGSISIADQIKTQFND